MHFFADPITFWLIAARLSAMFIIIPGLSDFSIPNQAKIAIIVWLTLFILPQMPSANYNISGIGGMAFLVVGEAAIGLGIGLIVRILFVGFQMAGAIVDHEIGLMAAEQLNPLVSISGGVFARIFVIAGFFYFWIMDYFLLVLKALVTSFEVLPIAAFITQTGVGSLVKFSAGIFVSGIVLAAPVLAISFITLLSLGFITKAVQGVNIMFLSFAIRLAVGLVGIIVFFPLLLFIIRKELEQLLPMMTEYLMDIGVSS
ncbi:MAG: flagellar biosynthetic protein FliR [Verrucomicrobiota bacterium]